METTGQALARAKSNARFFGRPYWVFNDTSGNCRVETSLPVAASGWPHWVALPSGRLEEYAPAIKTDGPVQVID
jgi:hypothetical protein